MLVGYYNYTVILTYLGAATGMLGICLAAAENPGAALVCLLLCGLCDTFDGAIARTRQRTDAEKRFGIQIDSLSDLLCFGALPAAIGFASGMTAWYEMLLIGIYVLCVLIRLAYFNVTEEEFAIGQGKKRTAYEGLPVTSAAIVIPAIYTVRPLLPSSFHFIFAAGLLLLSLAYVCKVTVRKPGLTGKIICIIIGMLVLTGLIIGWNK